MKVQFMLAVAALAVIAISGCVSNQMLAPATPLQYSANYGSFYCYGGTPSPTACEMMAKFIDADNCSTPYQIDVIVPEGLFAYPSSQYWHWEATPVTPGAPAIKVCISGTPTSNQAAEISRLGALRPDWQSIGCLPNWEAGKNGAIDINMKATAECAGNYVKTSIGGA